MASVGAFAKIGASLPPTMTMQTVHLAIRSALELIFRRASLVRSWTISRDLETAASREIGGAPYEGRLWTPMRSVSALVSTTQRAPTFTASEVSEPVLARATAALMFTTSRSIQQSCSGLIQ